MVIIVQMYTQSNQGRLLTILWKLVLVVHYFMYNIDVPKHVRDKRHKQYESYRIAIYTFIKTF